MAFISMVSHYISSRYKVETTLLRLRRLRGLHSNENITEAVLEVISKYSLTNDKIGWFILNNITSNDTYMAEILKALRINDIIKRRCLYYLNHIINLIIKAFIRSKS